MSIEDDCVSIHPYFRVPKEHEQEVMDLCADFIALTKQESLCLYYGFSRAGDVLYCREGYQGAAGALAHLKNVAEPLEKILKLCKLLKLEVHGQQQDLEQLKPALSGMPVEFFEMQLGFRN